MARVMFHEIDPLDRKSRLPGSFDSRGAPAAPMPAEDWRALDDPFQVRLQALRPRVLFQQFLGRLGIGHVKRVERDPVDARWLAAGRG
jgi:hypothetical protein